MRLNDGGIILIITIVTIAGVIGYLSSRLGGMKDDNAIEEFCEVRFGRSSWTFCRLNAFISREIRLFPSGSS